MNFMEKRLQVLIVDDDIDTRSIYAEAMRSANFDVTEANDGLEGLEQVNKNVPDLIISGIIMPRMDGFQFVEALKKNVATSQVPVMFFSHLGREEDERRSKELGVKDFLIQNMTPPNEMILRINEYFMNVDYLLAIDNFAFDASRFAKDFQLNTDFVCFKENKETGRVGLKLRPKKDNPRLFDAEITCI